MAVETASNETRQQYELLINQYRLLVSQHNQQKQMLIAQVHQHKLLIDQYRLLIKHHHLMLGEDEAASEEAVRLVCDIIADDQHDLDLANAAGVSQGVAAAAAAIVRMPPREPARLMPARTATGGSNGAARTGPAPSHNQQKAPEKTAPDAPPPQDRSAASAAKPKVKPKANDPEREPTPRKYRIILASATVFFTIYAAWIFLGGPPGASALASRALSAGTKEERLRAAHELCQHPGVDPELLKVAMATKDPEVLSVIVNHMPRVMDNLPTFFAAMKDENAEVRQAGSQAALSYYGGSLPLELTYKVDDAPEQRTAVASKLLDHFKHPPVPPP
jgi:hypothetical protein